VCTDWSNEADFKDSDYFKGKDFDSDYAELMNVLGYNSESHSKRLSMVWMDGGKRFTVQTDEFK
jgi:outer membrane protease